MLTILRRYLSVSVSVAPYVGAGINYGEASGSLSGGGLSTSAFDGQIVVAVGVQF